jgi:hypothetical protein
VEAKKGAIETAKLIIERQQVYENFNNNHYPLGLI